MELTCRPLLVVTPFPLHQYEKNVFLFYTKKLKRGCVKHRKHSSVLISLIEI